MLAQEIQKRIEAEISGLDASAHGWGFRRYLLSEPQRSEMKDHAGNPYLVWVVLVEPGSGYSVVFDEDELEFGLATGGVVIGTYGGFVAAINAM